jgi:ABC-2 type transport system permease protein
MNTPSNAVPEPALDAQVSAPAAVSETRPMYWSVQRELWENRSLYVAPLVVAAVFFFGFSISTITLPRRMRAVLALDPAQQPAALAMPFSMAATLIIFTGYIVGVFYCLDALHGERRDRSILFWKSLPVSDLTTVLSKASIPLVVLPVLVFTIALATQLGMRMLSTTVLVGSGVGAATLWARLPLFQMTLVLLYGLTVHVLWHAPLWAYLLLVSSWARRTPFLWAVLPPLALGLFERIAFQTTHFGALMKYRVMGAMAEAFVLKPGDKGLIIRLTQLDPSGFLSSPGLWLGLIAAALFLVVAVRLRRRGEPL